MDAKRVAIIGAGRSGLLSAKYLKQYGLDPFVFEKSQQIGGLWSQNTAIWEGLYSNISKYTMSIVDHPWPETTCVFPSKSEVQNYLITYAERFNLKDNIFLRHKVLNAKQTENKKWELEYINLETGRITVEVFDYLVISSGLQSKPRMPVLKNQSRFKGIIMHSSEFQLNDPKLRDKKVLVVGCSHSGVDISAELVNHARSIINVFARPYLVVSRLVKIPVNERRCNIVPLDFFGNTRSALHAQTTVSDKEKQILKKQFYKTKYPIQTNRDLIHPALYVDVDDKNVDIVSSICDSYIDLVRENKIIPKRGTIKELESNGVTFEDNTFEEVDVIILSTGYDYSLDYLEKPVLEKLKVENDKCSKFQLLVYMYTFNPYVENFALNSMVDLVQFRGAELQAKYIAMVFSGELKLDEAKMKQSVERLRAEIHSNTKRLQSPYGFPTEIGESLAKEMNLQPDLDILKRNDPELYTMFWEGLLMSCHYFYERNEERTRSIMKEVDEMSKKEYEIGKNEPDLTFQDILTEFNQVYQVQNN